MTSILIAAWLVVGLASLLAFLPPASDPYTDFSPDAGFPADEKKLLHMHDTANVDQMRAHAWWVWSLLAQEWEGGEPLCGHCSAPTPIWHTWYTTGETFTDQGQGGRGDAKGPRRTARLIQQSFEAPLQFEGLKNQRDIIPVSKVLFNAAAMEHVRSKRLHSKEELDRLSNDTAIDSIPKFPPGAVVLKTVWWPIKKEGSTLLPVWDFKVEPVWDRAEYEGDQRRTLANNIRDWERWVAVAPDYDPVIDRDRTIEKELPGKPGVAQQVPIVPLSRLHHLQITEKDLGNAQAIVEDFEGLTEEILDGSSLNVGDYLVLVAMHVVTKELPDWVWATFWWHDKPECGLYASARPDTVQRVWRNYLMDTTVNKENPREFDGSYNVCYNPWLEGPLSGGFVSNCIRCHQHAKWGKPRPPSTKVAQMPGLLPEYEERLDLDYLFSIGRGQ